MAIATSEVVRRVILQFKVEAAGVSNELEKVKQKSKETTDGLHEGMEKVSGSVDKLKGFVTGLAGVFGARELVQGVAELIEEHEKLVDTYTELSNKALKFATDTKSVDVVIDQQVKLAADLHSSLDGTIGLYDAVGDATDELGLSQRELTRLTRTLGESSVLAGKSLEGAGNIMARLSAAMTAGADGANDLKKIIRDFPELGQAWTKAFDTDKAGLIDMAKSGKLQLDDLVQAWVKTTDGIDDAFNRRKKTYAEERREWQENTNIALNRGVPALLATSEAGRKWHETMQKMNEGWETDARPMFNEIANNVQDQVTEWHRLEKAAQDAVGEKLRDSIAAASTEISSLSAALSSAAGKAAVLLRTKGLAGLRTLADPWYVAPDLPGEKKEKPFDLGVSESPGIKVSLGEYLPKPEFKIDPGMLKMAEVIEEIMKQLRKEEPKQTFLQKLGLHDPAAIDLAKAAVDGLSSSISGAFEGIATGGLSAGDATRKVLGGVVHSMGDQLAAFAGVELVKGTAMALTLSPEAPLHFGAAALYGAGSIAAYAAANSISPSGGARASISTPTPAGAGSGAIASGIPTGRDQRYGGGAPSAPGQPTIIVIGETFADMNPRERARNAREYMKAGGINTGMEDS